MIAAVKEPFTEKFITVIKAKKIGLGRAKNK